MKELDRKKVKEMLEIEEAYKSQMTLEELKRDLPDIKVMYRKKEYSGKIKGRMLDFPQVIIPELGIGWEFCWKTVLHCVNNNKAVIAEV